MKFARNIFFFFTVISAAFLILLDIEGLFGWDVIYILLDDHYEPSVYLTLIIFRTSLVGLLTMMMLGVKRHGQTQSDDQQLTLMNNARYGAVAFCSILSIVCVVALIASSSDIKVSILIWVLYIMICGLIIDTEPGQSFSNIYRYSIAPSLALLATGVFVAIVTALIYEAFECISCGGGSFNGDLMDLLLLYASIALLTTFAITTACLARTQVVQIIGHAIALDNEKLLKLKKTVNIVLSIILILGAAILLRA
ncbi:MAG: hypothetical protein Tsb002_20910 [Wenzhouxiangellaceae bacterium]